MSVAELSDVTRVFRARRPLRNFFAEPPVKVVLEKISLKISRGEFVGIVGANGSGKTTLLRIMAGILFPSSGFVRVPKSLTYISAADRQFHERLTGYQNLRFFARLSDVSPAEIAPACEAMGLSRATIDEQVWTYSSGMKHRLSLARALLGKSELLLLDEPTRSLDDAGRRDLKDRLKSIDAAIVVASHDADFLTGADRVVKL